MIYSNKAYDIGMVELAAVVTFTDKIVLKFFPLCWNIRCVDEDGVYLFSSTRGSAIPCLEDYSVRSSP